MSEAAEIHLWGRMIGAVSLDEGAPTAVFQYTPAFARSSIQLAPLMMPLRPEPFAFPALSHESFKGLPGLLADSLPDRWGSALIDTWLAGQGRSPGSASSVERLCYVGARAMGALEFRPTRGPQGSPVEEIQIQTLVSLASEILSEREEFIASLREGREEEALLEILSVGMSAGGARAKALIAWNPETEEIRSAQVPAPAGFEQWLLKFDGVSGNKDKESLEDPEGHGATEFAYFKMATAAGISMSECRLFEENGRRHFMTRRFDRPSANAKLHLQSLGAIAHYDFNRAGACSYEQAMMVIRRLGLSMAEVEQQFRRMTFNIIARNQDDHVKNIAFLMDQGGRWSLAPAFDMTFAYNSRGDWTAQHQMTLNGKRDGFSLADFEQCAEAVSMKRGRAAAIIEEVRDAVAEWPVYAGAAGVDPSDIARIARAHRQSLARR
ncbi:MAG: type II toxin-antitoxin system HipA family toxin [Solirubrobacterales bacterium]